MQVILLEKVRNLGSVGNKVNVKPGFGRNFLIPNGKAVFATEANIAKFEARRAELEAAAAEKLGQAKARAEKFQDMKIVIQARAAEEGKLFGSIGIREIAKALADKGQKVEKSEIVLSEGTIRKTGEYPITLQLHSDVAVTVIVNIVPEEIEAS